MSSPKPAETVKGNADLTVWEDFYNKFQEQHRNMGKTFSVEDRVEERLAELDAKVEEVSAQAADAARRWS